MKKESDKKEEGKKEVRQKISCEKCNSHYVYVLKDLTTICRRCGHRSQPKTIIKEGKKVDGSN